MRPRPPTGLGSQLIVGVLKFCADSKPISSFVLDLWAFLRVWVCARQADARQTGNGVCRSHCNFRYLILSMNKISPFSKSRATVSNEVVNNFSGG